MDENVVQAEQPTNRWTTHWQPQHGTPSEYRASWETVAGSHTWSTLMVEVPVPPGSHRVTVTVEKRQEQP